MNGPRLVGEIPEIMELEDLDLEEISGTKFQGSQTNLYIADTFSLNVLFTYSTFRMHSFRMSWTI